MSSADSHGHLTSRNDPVLIIDLDETLLSINSFPVWAAYFLFEKFAGLDFRRRSLLWLKAAKIFTERKALGRSHAQTKFALHKLWVQAGDADALENILTKLEQKIRPNMRGIMDLVAKKEIDAVLATAATSLYAEPLAKRLGFSHVLSTGLDGVENRSDEKSRRSLEFLARQGWESRKKIFFTDHIEDTPLIIKSDKVMWFGKTEEAQILEQSVPALDIVICRDLSAQEIVKEIY